MSAVAWPEGVRLHQLTGITRRRQSGHLRTQMEHGPPKSRKRFSAVSRYVNVPVEWTGAEYKLFEAWYENDIEEGALPFTWDDPMTGDSVTMRFRDTPEFRHDLPGDTDEQWWSATLSLEILP